MLHAELWQQLAQLDEQETSQRANCQFLQDPDRYLVTMLNTEYTVNLTDRQIFSSQHGSEPKSANFLEQLCLLAYLINSKDLPLAGKLAKAESLPGGQFFYRGPHELPTPKLQEVFGPNPDLIRAAGAQLNAKPYDFGDASVELFVLPRIPLVFVIWAGDEEFEARASILFDQTAAEQLPLDALAATVDIAVNAMIKAASQND